MLTYQLYEEVELGPPAHCLQCYLAANDSGSHTNVNILFSRRR